MDKKLTIKLFFAFVLTIIIGTITHEAGHYYTSKALGYDAYFAYGMVYTTGFNKEASKVWEEERENPNMERINIYQKKRNKIMLGGPLTSIFIGLAGTLFLLIKRTKDKSKSLLTWIIIFFSLFILRCVYIGLCGLNKLFSQTINLKSDEEKIFWHYEIDMQTGFILLALLPLPLVLFTLKKWLTKKEWVSFLVAGALGIPAGFYLWYVVLGPVLLPPLEATIQ